MREQEVNSDILNLERSRVEADLEGLSHARDYIEKMALRLDDGDPHHFLAIYVRIGEIKERQILGQIPNLAALKVAYDERVYFQEQLEAGRLPSPQLIEGSDELIERLGGTIYFTDQEPPKKHEDVTKTHKEARLIYTIPLPDGQFVRVQGTRRAEILQIILRAEEYSLPSDQYSMVVFGSDTKKNRDNLSGHVSKLNRTLKEKNWVIDQPVTITQRAQGQKAVYTLKQIQVKEQLPSVEPETALKPNLEVNLETREIKIEDSDWIKIPDDTDWEVLTYLIENRGREVFSNESRLLACAQSSVGYTEETGQKRATDNSLKYLLRILKIESKPVLMEAQHKKNTGYRLNIGVVEFIEEELGNLEEDEEQDFGPQVFGGSAIDIPRIEQIGFLGEGEILEIPYEPREDEKRSEVEDKILSFTVDTILKNKPVTFEEIQVALATQKTITRLPHNMVKIDIYQADELKEMFTQALRKIREEAEITGLRERWSVEEKALFESLQESVRKLSGRNISDFQTKVRRMIDNAERRFYNSLPADQRSRKILFITVDNKELEGRE